MDNKRDGERQTRIERDYVKAWKPINVFLTSPNQLICAACKKSKLLPHQVLWHRCNDCGVVLAACLDCNTSTNPYYSLKPLIDKTCAIHLLMALDCRAIMEVYNGGSLGDLAT